jgi:uncharacterized membrane protein YedE/YeeE
MKALMGLLCGLIFGTGLAVSGMTDTAKVLGFLDLFGTWVPDLAFVMGGAVCVTLVAFRFVLKRQSPLIGKKFFLPSSTVLDGKLLAGGALFGIGWGIYGYCPGPAMSAMVYLDRETFIFVVAMLVGMALANRVGKA